MVLRVKVYCLLRKIRLIQINNSNECIYIIQLEVVIDLMTLKQETNVTDLVVLVIIHNAATIKAIVTSTICSCI
jgi:hypothetical protein